MPKQEHLIRFSLKVQRFETSSIIQTHNRRFFSPLLLAIKAFREMLHIWSTFYDGYKNLLQCCYLDFYSIVLPSVKALIKNIFGAFIGFEMLQHSIKHLFLLFVNYYLLDDSFFIYFFI